MINFYQWIDYLCIEYCVFMSFSCGQFCEPSWAVMSPVFHFLYIETKICRSGSLPGPIIHREKGIACWQPSCWEHSKNLCLSYRAMSKMHFVLLPNWLLLTSQSKNVIIVRDKGVISERQKSNLVLKSQLSMKEAKEVSCFVTFSILIQVACLVWPLTFTTNKASLMKRDSKLM